MRRRRTSMVGGFLFAMTQNYRGFAQLSSFFAQPLAIRSHYANNRPVTKNDQHCQPPATKAEPPKGSRLTSTHPEPKRPYTGDAITRALVETHQLCRGLDDSNKRENEWPSCNE